MNEGTNGIILNGLSEYFQLYLTVKHGIHEDNHLDAEDFLRQHEDFVWGNMSFEQQLHLADEIWTKYAGLYEELKQLNEQGEDWENELKEFEETYQKSLVNIKLVQSLQQKLKEVA